MATESYVTQELMQFAISDFIPDVTHLNASLNIDKLPPCYLSLDNGPVSEYRICACTEMWAVICQLSNGCDVNRRQFWVFAA